MQTVWKAGSLVLGPRSLLIRARHRVLPRGALSRRDKKNAFVFSLLQRNPSSRSQHLCCITPRVLGNIKNAGGVNKIHGYRATGMKQAFAVVKKQGTYDEVQAAWKAAQSPAEDTENVDPDGTAVSQKREAAEEPAFADNQVAA